MLPQSLRDSSLPEGAGSIVPPSGREGDREAVEGERRRLSGLRAFQIEETFFARMLPQSLRDSSLPEGANANENFPLMCLPPGGRGTAKRWKENGESLQV